MIKPFVFGFCAFFCGAPLFAQKTVLKAAAKAAVKYGPVRAELLRAPGRAYDVDLFEKLLGHEEEPVFRSVYNRALEGDRLESLVFGRVRAARDSRNNLLTRLGWTARWERFKAQENAVRSSVRGRLYGNAPISYDKIMDFSSRLVFLGEEHGSGPIMDEVVRFVADYARRHPQTPVYMATEFLNTRDAAGNPAFILDEAGLDAYEYAVWGEDFRRFKFLASQGVKLAGLEDWAEFQAQTRAALSEGDVGVQEDLLLEREMHLARSLYGVEARNRAWARRLRLLRRTAGPEAVIFVYAGSFHVNRSAPNNLPSLLGDKTSPVITFASFGTESVDYFLWDGYLRPSAREVFDAPHAPDAKERPAKLLEWTDNSAYAPLLGCDARVWFF